MTTLALLASTEAALQDAISSANADAQTVVALQQQVATLTQQLASASAGGVKQTITEFSKFAATAYVGQQLPNQLKGGGRDLDVRRMKAHTSQYTTAPLSTQTPPTNLLQMFRAGGSSGAIVSGMEISDLQLQATDQGHEYHLFNLVYARKAVVRDMKLLVLPGITPIGSSNAPPHETGVLATNHMDELRLINVEVDGSNLCGSVLLANNSHGLYVTGGRYNRTTKGISATCYQISGKIEFTDVDLSDTRKPANVEQCGQAEHIYYTRCDFRKKTHPSHLSVNGNNGSTKVVITDPLVDAWPFSVWSNNSSDPAKRIYQGARQTQELKDYTLIVDGQDVSDNPKFLERVGG